MTVAIAILADHRHKRVAELAEFLARAGVNLCIHVDSNGPADEFRALRHRLSSFDNILFANQIACGWGQFSLVEAELEMCRTILDAWPDVSHIQLISGDSLPLNAIRNLKHHLATHPDTDFIESVSVTENNWVVAGLGLERFTLRFPFSWKKQRRLFDLWVVLQRKLRLKRPMPEGLRPYIGSQWWCLTRETVAAILNDPHRPLYDAYFRSAWIPDESYFQTLVRKHARRLEAHSLMYSQFDHQGKPVTFYDDHADMLADANMFFARKIWPGADELYKRFLQAPPSVERHTEKSLPEHIALASDRRRKGREGLRMIGRAPNQWHEKQPVTAAPYQVFTGISPVFPTVNNWFRMRNLTNAHGRLFAPDRAYFADDALIAAGGLSNRTRIRDNAPECFLRNMIWQYRAENPAFHFEPADSSRIETFLACDPNAHVHLVEYGWVLDLARRGMTNPDALRVTATHLMMREQLFIEKLGQVRARCNLSIWTLGEALGNPAPVLRAMLDALGAEGAKMPLALPEMADADAGLAFARMLKNIGVDIDLRKLDTGTNRAIRPLLSSVNQ